MPYIKYMIDGDNDISYDIHDVRLPENNSLYQDGYVLITSELSGVGIMEISTAEDYQLIISGE